MAWERKQPLARISATNQKVMILIPHKGESGYRQWERWYRDMIKPPGTSYLEQRGLSLTTNRTGLVIEALKSDAEYFFFLDDDVIGPNDMLTTLMGHSLQIVSGLYMAKKRKEERGLAAWMKVGNNGYLPIAPEQGARLVQVDVCGLGACLLHRSIFEKVPQPWFVWEFGGVSEDFWFFEKVSRELGIKPIIDMELRCRHIGTFLLDTDNSFTTLEI